MAGVVWEKNIVRLELELAAEPSEWLLVSRYPPDMDVLLVDTHLPDSDGISVVIPVPLFFKDKLYKKRFLFLRFIFMYYFDIDISLWAF